MKIKSGFLLREIAGSTVVIPIGERVIDFKGMMMPNETGSFIWGKLQNDITEDEILQSITDEYDVDSETAVKDLNEFLAEVRSVGALEE